MGRLRGLQRGVLRVFPQRTRWRIEIAYAKRSGDAELALLPALLDSDSTFVDVGANAGVYSKCATFTGAKVVAFEPIASVACQLRTEMRRRAIVHALALGAAAENATLHIPLMKGRAVDTRASLDPTANGDVELRTESVRVVPLDELVRSASMVKIDVEGAELDVLRSSTVLLTRSKPFVIVEVEARHSGLGRSREVFELLHKFGYHGYFLDPERRKRLRPLAEFSFERHQSPELQKPVGKRRVPGYINNFLFVHSSNEDDVLRRLARHRFAAAPA